MPYTQDNGVLQDSGHQSTRDVRPFALPTYLSGSQAGSSVAISGDGLTLIIGAATEDEQPPVPYHPKYPPGLDSSETPAYIFATRPGAAFVYIWNEIAEQWQFQTKLEPTDRLSDSCTFGFSVALSEDGNIAVVGAPNDGVYENMPEDSGPDYYFATELDSWLHSFGGYPYTPSQFGGVWIFVRNESDDWEQNSILRPPLEPNTLSTFGYSVAITTDGTTIAVGDNTSGVTFDAAAPAYGRVFVYTSQEGENSWSLNSTLDSERQLYAMGTSVAFAGLDKLVIGAPVYSTLTEFVSLPNGKVGTAIKDDDGNWILSSTYLEGGYTFGMIVSASETTLVATSFFDPFSYGGTGEAVTYSWDEDSQEWIYVSTLMPGHVDSGPFNFRPPALSLNADGDVLAVGVFSTDQVEIYSRHGSEWFLSDNLHPSDGVDFLGLGGGTSVSMNLDGTKIITGAPQNANYIGGAWIFNGTPIPIQYWGSVVSLSV